MMMMMMMVTMMMMMIVGIPVDDDEDDDDDDDDEIDDDGDALLLLFSSIVFISLKTRCLLSTSSGADAPRRNKNLSITNWKIIFITLTPAMTDVKSVRTVMASDNSSLMFFAVIFSTNGFTSN